MNMETAAAVPGPPIARGHADRPRTSGHRQSPVPASSSSTGSTVSRQWVPVISRPAGRESPGDPDGGGDRSPRPRLRCRRPADPSPRHPCSGQGRAALSAPLRGGDRPGEPWCPSSPGWRTISTRPWCARLHQRLRRLDHARRPATSRVVDWTNANRLEEILVVGICRHLCHGFCAHAPLGAQSRHDAQPQRKSRVYEAGCSTYDLPRAVAEKLGHPPPPATPGRRHYMGLYFMASRGKKLVDRVTVEGRTTCMRTK